MTSEANFLTALEANIRSYKQTRQRECSLKVEIGKMKQPTSCIALYSKFLAFSEKFDIMIHNKVGKVPVHQYDILRDRIGVRLAGSI